MGSLGFIRRPSNDLKGSVNTVSTNNNNNNNNNNTRKSIISNRQVGRNSISDILLGKPTPSLIFVEGYKYDAQNNGKLRRTEEIDHDLYGPFRSFLTFGKFIGLIPFEGLFQSDVELLTFRKTSMAAIINILIILMLTINTIAGAISMVKFNGKSAAEYAWAPAPFLFYAIGTYVYTYIYRHSAGLIEIFKKWSRMDLRFSQRDTKLRRDVNLVAGILMTSAVLENAVAHLKLFPFVAQSEVVENSVERPGASALEVYTVRSHPIWLRLVPFHPILAIYLLICNKLSLYAWNYMDITIALFARAIYFKFKALYYEAEAVMFGGNASSSYDVHRWRQLCADHSLLCAMLQEMASFLSPLIFASFAVNIYYVCLQLNLGLTPAANNSAIASVYAIWSFVHLIARVYTISLSCARINDWAHKVALVFRKCPNEAYTIDVERTERYVGTNPIGFGGIGCFLITKPFILQIVSVVFTFEIVLLQAAQTTF